MTAATSVFSELKILKSDLPRQRIREFVEELINTGRLTPGTEIPSTRELSSKWGVGATIVHSALADLVETRKLIRRHGKGTFVAEEIARLHTVGLYAKLESLSDPNKWFSRSVLVEVKKAMERRGIGVHAWMDPRSATDSGTMWGSLERAAQRREMQGLILVDAPGNTLKWAQSLPLPLAAITPKNLPYSVGTDSRQMFELGMQRLARSGCKSLGLITVHPASQVYEDYYDSLIEMASHYGLKIKNSWIRIPRNTTLSGFALTKFGYDEFHALWNLKDRPDGLLVEPDITVEGTLMAILERGVRVPSDLKLVLHRNESRDYLCPFSVSQIVTSEKAIAEALITQIERQVSGEPFSRIVQPYQLIEKTGPSGARHSNPKTS